MLGRPSEKGHLLGLAASLFHRRGTTAPGAGPIVMVPLPAAGGEPMPPFGLLEQDHPDFARYSRLLDDAEANGFARLAGRTQF
jgi:hypothetical protein